jgi:hypothetical protein
MRFCYFCVAHNTKNFVMKFCILIDYNFNYVLIYFQKFLNLKIWFLIFLNGGSTGAREPKAFSDVNSFMLLEVTVPFIYCAREANSSNKNVNSYNLTID